MTESSSNKCIACERGSEEVPLIVLEFRGKALRICPQHMPLLIHDPAKLVGKLEGAADMKPADG